MPPRGRGSRGGGSAQNSIRGIQSYFVIPQSKEEEKEGILGKRDGERDLEGAPPAKRLHYEPQSSFANFMNKKGDIISRFMQEKGVSEYTCEEHFSFKS
jgi:hypothetical protein